MIRYEYKSYIRSSLFAQYFQRPHEIQKGLQQQMVYSVSNEQGLPSCGTLPTVTAQVLMRQVLITFLPQHQSKRVLPQEKEVFGNQFTMQVDTLAWPADTMGGAEQLRCTNRSHYTHRFTSRFYKCFTLFLRTYYLEHYKFNKVN